MSETDERPTGRELRLVNAAIDLLMFLEHVPGVTLTDPARMKLERLRECVELYRAHMLKPRMKQPTLIPVRIAGP
jgi:hypothetical protein